MRPPLRFAYCRQWPLPDGSYDTRDLEELHWYGFDEVFVDTLKTVRDRQPAVAELIEYASYASSDREVSITVPELAQFGRSLSHITSNLCHLLSQGVDVIVLRGLGHDEPFAVRDLSAVGVLEVLDEARSMLASQKIRRGQEAARSQGRMGGRPRKLDDDQRAQVRRRLDEGEEPWRIARAFGVSETTIRRIAAARRRDEQGDKIPDVKDADGTPQTERRQHVRVHAGGRMERTTRREGDEE